MITKRDRRPGPMADTPEWHQARATRITATDMGAILGRSDYKTALDVYLEKTGQTPGFEGNEHTRRGQRYEPVIVADYAAATGHSVRYPLPLFFHPSIDCIAATPDAEASMDGETPRGVEVKLTMSRTRALELGDEGTDFIPDDWLLQSQTQMAVMGWEYVDLAILLFGRLRIYPVGRNDKLIRIIESAAIDMYERVLNRVPPEPQWDHPRTLDIIKSLYVLKTGLTVELSQECEALVTAYKDLGAELKERERERDAVKARLLHEMGDAEIGTLPGLGLEVIRSTMERAAYTVGATTYETMRIRKVKA